ncbi:MAG: MFS transporter [Bacilli bacterium]|nr:MFS transporter [Bacilli bacterium]
MMKKNALLLLMVIYLAFIALGLPDALLGSAWNLVRVDLNVSLGSLGIITVVVYSMSILATFNAPRLLRLLETKKITIISVVFTGLALVGISYVNHFYQMVIFAIPMGIGAGAIDVSLNHYLASNYKAKHMNYLHSFYGIGMTVGPTIMAYTLAQNSWRTGYFIVGIILIGIALVVLLSFPLWKKETKIDRDESHSHMSLKEILGTKGAKNSILIFLLYVHIETLGGVWIASYMFIQKEISYASAALFTTTFFLALTIGRVMSGILSSKLKPNTMIKGGMMLILISAILLLFEFNSIYVYFAIVFLYGLGCAPVFPNMMLMNSINFEKRKLSKIMSLQMAFGYMGYGILTPLAGLFFEQVAISYYPLFILVVIFILILITLRFMKMKDQELIKSL